MKEVTEIAALKRTPLFHLHQEFKARMTGFGGWEMPVQYAGISVEHQAVRQRVGMFDISHMGKFALRGKNLVAQLQPLVPSDLGRLQVGRARYTVLLNSQAGILDDIIFYYQGRDAADGQERGLMIVNASTTAKDKAWLLAQLDSVHVHLQDLSLAKTLIAVQGPEAVAYLQSLTSEDLTQIKPFSHQEATVLDQPAFFARTGYTGEDGFEVMAGPEAGSYLWRSLLKRGVTPCGLGARDTLRLEAAMVLYGQDIDETTTPLEAGLGWVVHLDKGNFIGRSVLEQQQKLGVQRQLVGLQMQGRNIARHGYPVLFESQSVGVVTSGIFAPTVGRAIALAYVPAYLAQPGQALDVEIRGKAYPAIVVPRPFYRRVK